MARTFNGSTDKISATAVDFGSADFTYFAWIKPTVASGAILRAEASGGTQQAMVMSTGFTIDVQTNFDTTNAQSTTSTTVTNGGWSLVVSWYTLSTKQYRIWLGNLSTAMGEAAYSAQVTGVSAAATGTTNMLIGNRTSGAAAYTGSIGSCGVYSRNIALAEMESIRGGHIPFKNLLYFWPLTDASTANDFELITGFNGTPTGTGYDADPLPISIPGTNKNTKTLRPAIFKPGLAR